uniref:Polyprotein protein n=1 Tax=Solanum tuberosum TaxID=4113 RepID=M1DMX0_SOLTU
MIEIHTLRLYDLIARIDAEEKAGSSSSAIDTLRNEIATLRAEVVQLQSADISMLWGEVPLSYVPEMPSVVPSSTMHEDDVDDEFVVDDASERGEEELDEENDDEDLRA